VRGADGTQILYPDDRFDPHFFYFACKALDIESRGYNRHLSILKEREIPIPPKEEQELIGKILAIIESHIDGEQRTCDLTTALKRAAMRELFTRGLHNKAQKETEIGLVPENWKVLPLGSIALLERGRFLHRPRNEPRFYGGKIPFVQTGDVVKSGGKINTYTQSLNEEGVAISRVFPKGTILITIAANIGYTGILGFDSACPDSIIAITPQTEIDARYLEYFLQTQQSEMDRRAPKGTQKNINIQFLTPWLVAIPSLPEQLETVEILDTIDRKIELHKKKKTLLEELFKSLLHKLMTGEIRIADLDLPAIGKAAD